MIKGKELHRSVMNEFNFNLLIENILRQRSTKVEGRRGFFRSFRMLI